MCVTSLSVVPPRTANAANDSRLLSDLRTRTSSEREGPSTSGSSRLPPRGTDGAPERAGAEPRKPYRPTAATDYDARVPPARSSSRADLARCADGRPGRAGCATGHESAGAVIAFVLVAVVAWEAQPARNALGRTPCTPKLLAASWSARALIATVRTPRSRSAPWPRTDASLRSPCAGSSRRRSPAAERLDRPRAPRAVDSRPFWSVSPVTVRPNAIGAMCVSIRCPSRPPSTVVADEPFGRGPSRPEVCEVKTFPLLVERTFRRASRRGDGPLPVPVSSVFSRSSSMHARPSTARSPPCAASSGSRRTRYCSTKRGRRRFALR